jgi:hypothetical protein
MNFSHDNADSIYEVLYNLSYVSRFKLVLTFLKNEEKQGNIYIYIYLFIYIYIYIDGKFNSYPLP